MAINNINAVIKEFDTTHGECVVSGEWLIYEDGASREISPYGVMISPPKDDYERHQRIFRFHKVRFDLAVQQFDQEKLALEINIKTNLRQKNCPNPPSVEKATQYLKKLRIVVANRKVALQEAEEQLDAVTPKRISSHARIDAENRQRNQQIINALQDIEI